jgi:hypothetical protein
LQAFVKGLPQPELTRKVYVGLHKFSYACKQVFNGELSPGIFLRKAYSVVGKRSVLPFGHLLTIFPSDGHPVISWALDVWLGS